MVHIETRPPKDVTGAVVLEVLMTVEIVKDRIIHLAHRVKNAKYVNMAKLVGCKRATVQVRTTNTFQHIRLKSDFEVFNPNSNSFQIRFVPFVRDFRCI